MNLKSPIKKIFTIIIWCLLGGSGLALIIAAINSKNGSLCQGIEVEINGAQKSMFLTKKDVVSIIEGAGEKDLRNKKISSIDMLRLENVLRKNNWIKDAQLYFDNNQMLKVRVQERQAIARLFTTSGNSYLIDSSGVQMPLSAKTVFNLPVFTGYPSEKFGLRKDSSINKQISDLAAFINASPFWSNQIQEINITPAKTFLMTPLIGNQMIDFGNGNDYADKFHRLFTFYKEVISKTGFEKYTGINLAFENQVIATRKQGLISRADSIQARKNVLEMIRLSQKMEADSTKIRDVKPLEKNTVTEQNLQSYDIPEETIVNPTLDKANQKQH